MAIYQWRRDAVMFRKADAQAVGEELERLREAHDGLTATDIVRAAKAAGSPLHGFFPWDDKAAAKMAREMIANRLIRAITVRTVRAEGKPIDTRAFVSAKTTDKPRHYTSLEIAMDDPEGRAFLVREAWLKLIAWRRQYAEIAELAEIHAAIDAAAVVRRSA